MQRKQSPKSTPRYAVKSLLRKTPTNEQLLLSHQENPIEWHQPATSFRCGFAEEESTVTSPVPAVGADGICAQWVWRETVWTPHTLLEQLWGANQPPKGTFALGDGQAIGRIRWMEDRKGRREKAFVTGMLQHNRIHCHATPASGQKAS